MAIQCKNPKPDGSWCGVPIEWREVGTKPDGSPKKRPFEVDTGQQHNCPYWKKSFVDFKKTAQKVEQEITATPKSPSTQQGLVQEQVNQGAKIQRIEQEIAEIKRTLHDLGKAVAQMSNKTAAELMKEEEVAQED